MAPPCLGVAGASLATLLLLLAPLEDEDEVEVYEGLEDNCLGVAWRGAGGAVAVFILWRLLLSPGDSLSARLVLLTMEALEGVRVRTVLTEATEMLLWSSTEEL